MPIRSDGWDWFVWGLKGLDSSGGVREDTKKKRGTVEMRRQRRRMDGCDALTAA